MTTEPVHDIDLGASSPAGALGAGADRASAGRTSLSGPALASARGTAGKARATRRWYRWTERWAVVGCLVVVVALFSALRPSTYATFSNLQSVLTSQATLLMVALLLTVVLAAGDLDLSIGGMITFSAVIVAVLSVNDQLPFVAALTRDNILGVVYGGRAHAAPAEAAS